MDSVTNSDSTANDLLSFIGMKIKRDRKVTLPAIYSTSWMSRMGQNKAYAIEGGDVLFRSAEGDPILSMAQVGEGMIAVMTFSQLFTNPPMGGSYRIVPNQQQRDIYNLEFNLLKGLSEGNLITYFKK